MKFHGMEQERYFFYPMRCPDCGQNNLGSALFCGSCGRYLKTPRIMNLLKKVTGFESVSPMRDSKEPDRIYACELERMPFGFKYGAMNQIGKGDLAIKFCGCGMCRQLENELMVYFEDFLRLYNPETLEKLKRNNY
ncbi:MAG: hypothetical protein PHG80_10545 [Methanoregulaceae archaeon]|jgi:hypothetical protein|nr:hypothetical protein [Methanoregulaceae archaeon]HRX33396.1 hypothetical protein [Methanoregulaceae archaeon]